MYASYDCGFVVYCKQLFAFAAMRVWERSIYVWFGFMQPELVIWNEKYGSETILRISTLENTCLLCKYVLFSWTLGSTWLLMAACERSDVENSCYCCFFLGHLQQQTSFGLFFYHSFNKWCVFFTHTTSANMKINDCGKLCSQTIHSAWCARALNTYQQNLFAATVDSIKIILLRRAKCTNRTIFAWCFAAKWEVLLMEFSWKSLPFEKSQTLFVSQML